MSAPPYILKYTAEADKVIEGLQDSRYRTEVRKTLRLLQDPGPGQNSHRYQSVPGPGGAALWESYVENMAPSAWRIWWTYGEADEIIIVTVSPATRACASPGTRPSPPARRAAATPTP